MKSGQVQSFRKLLAAATFLAAVLVSMPSLGDVVITSGPNVGKRLSVVLRASKSKIPEHAIDDAIKFFDKYKSTSRNYGHLALEPTPKTHYVGFTGEVLRTSGSTIGNTKYMVIFDLNRHSSQKRLHIINVETGAVESVEAAHGIESDCGGAKKGFTCKFISDSDSKASPLGFFATGELYTGEKGSQIRLNGLEKRSNGFSGNDIPSTIVIHKAPYVSVGHAGRSEGCPALSADVMAKVKDKLKDGALFYFYHSSLDYADRSPVVSGLVAPTLPAAIRADAPAAEPHSSRVSQ